MGTNKKLIILLIFLLLAFVGLNVFLISKYKTQLSRKKETKLVNETKQAKELKTTSTPFINTFEFPPAKAGKEYRAEVFATLPNVNEDLTISITGLPDGLILGKCSQKFDISLIPTPNTQIKCFIEGIPAKDGVYQVKVTAIDKSDWGIKAVEQMISLRVALP